jgi:hypothetical protein
MEDAYAVSPVTIEDIAAELRRLRQMKYASVLRRVRKNAVRCTVVCVERKRSLFKHLLQLRGIHGMIIWYLAVFDIDVYIRN